MSHEVTSDSNVISTHDDPEVVRVLEFYLAELESGRTPDRAALLAEHPRIAGPLAECLEGLDFLQQAVPNPESRDPIRVSDDQIGDFRLIRVIGRGGMGVVYEAEQVSFPRRVALKTLPVATAADVGSLRRFQHEIRAAATLSHPHIVPVFATGHDHGVHYFAMRLIPGRSLAELLDRSVHPSRTTAPNALAYEATDEANPTDVPCPDRVPNAAPLSTDARVLADWMRQAAEALGHAHMAGIVHRDVKPANLLLEGDHLWVADFGLAFVPGLSRLTHPDGMVGTLRYMSPEQIEPRHGIVDHRADLYGLGATFYELLTQRPVFGDADRAVLLSRILHDEPIPPRRLNSSLPVDLETILLTLLAKDPARRYASMAELAEELRRFLAGQPIQARRPSRVDRLFVWLGRHRRAALGVGLALMAFMGLLLVNQYRLRQEQAATRIERQEARQAVDDLYTAFAEHWLAHEPGQEPRQREFLEKARHHYERMAQSSTATLDDELAAAVAGRRVADILARLGQEAEAGQAYQSAHVRLTTLAQRHPTSQIQRELAICENDRGNWCRAQGQSQDAGRLYQSAAARFLALTQTPCVDRFDRAALAGTEANQGLVWLDREQFAEAEVCFRSARTRFAQLAREEPNQPVFLAESARCCHNLAEVFVAQGREPEAQSCYREGLTLLERVVELTPRTPSFQRDRSQTRTALAESLIRSQQAVAAQPLIRLAVAEWAELLHHFPNTPSYRLGFATALRIQAQAHRSDPDPTAARVAAHEAVVQLRRHPSPTGVALPLAQSLAILSQIDTREVAAKARSEAQDILKSVFPKTARDRRQVAEIQAVLAQTSR